MNDWKPRMRKIVAHLAEQFAGIRAGTLSVGFIETFRINLQGNTVALGRMAAVMGQKDRILVTPFDPSCVPAIVKSLVDAKLNAYAVNPKAVCVGIPPISGDQRKEMARHLNKLAEEAKVAIRMIRQDARKLIDRLGRGSQRYVQEETDLAIAEIERLLKAKLSELGV
jgi:ribosome recycling factor